MEVERRDDGFCIDAALLGELLDVPAADVHALLRSNRITSICERGEGEDDGRYRLTFFHDRRRVRLDVDEGGRVLRRSIIDFGAPPPTRTATAG